MAADEADEGSGLGDDDDDVPGEADAEEDAEEEPEEEDEGPTFGKDGRPQGPTPVFQVVDEVSTGSVVEVNGVQVYAAGKKGTQAGILVVSDFWGWHSGRVRVIADYLAKAMNAVTVVPRLLDTPCLEGGTDGDGLPAGFDRAGRQKELRAWMMRYVWQKFKTKIEAACIHLRTGGAKRIAGVGFGFGAWAVCRASEMVGEFVCSVLMYPSVHFMEEVMDGSHIRLAGKLRGPVLFMPAKDDPNMYHPDGDMVAAVRQNQPEDTDSMPFPDMVHDWVLRGDAGRKDVKAATEEAVMATAKYLRKFLWPPPPGANAATLRLMCQEGDSEMVRELLSAGIPAGGKDAVDVVGLSPLHYAAKCDGNVQGMRVLVDYEADVNISGGISGETALHVASAAGNVRAAKMLLQLRADPNKTDRGGQTSLHHAASTGCLPLVKMLVQAKASMQVKDTPPEQTPLHLAAWYGREEVVAFMLKARMDVDPEDLRSQTPEKRAKQQGFEAVAHMFEAERARRHEEKLLAEEAAKAAAKVAATLAAVGAG